MRLNFFYQVIKFCIFKSYKIQFFYYFEPVLQYLKYVCIYTEGYTQEVAADKLGYSPNYVYKMNRKLITFLYKHFKEEQIA